MATNQTEHYNLSQWELTDSVVMADFNADNQKIEQALTALDQKIADTAEQVKADIPRIQIGSYVGNGSYGADNPTTLTFDFEPQVVILTQKLKTSYCMTPATCLRGASSIVVAYNPEGQHEFRPITLYLTWDGPTLSFYSKEPYKQYNLLNTAYYYMAIG